MSSRRRKAIVVATVAAPAWIFLLLVPGSSAATATFLLVTFAALAILLRIFAGQLLRQLAVQPWALFLRQDFFAGWQEVIERVPEALARLWFAIPSNDDAVLAGPAHVRVRMSVQDAHDCRAHWELTDLGAQLTAHYRRDLQANHICISATDPVLVELVADPSVPRGRLRAEAVPSAAPDPGESATVQDPRPRPVDDPRVIRVAPPLDPRTRAEAARVGERQSAVATYSPTVQETLFRPLQLEVVYPAGPQDSARRFPVAKPTVDFGRGDGCDLVIDAETVSNRHGRFVWSATEGAWNVHELRSLNGAMINGRRLAGPCRVHDGDVVALGKASDAPRIIVRMPRAE